jgi:hypothetical protein
MATPAHDHGPIVYPPWREAFIARERIQGTVIHLARAIWRTRRQRAPLRRPHPTS